MQRTDVLWAGTIAESSGGGTPGFMLGEPDALDCILRDGQSVTLNKFVRASYEDLHTLFGSVIAGDAVAPGLLASADVVAFELNGNQPAPSGGWESCDWRFSDGTRIVSVQWDERITETGIPVPRDGHVIANGSITGAEYIKFFGITEAAMLKDHPNFTVNQMVVSFLLFRLRPELDTTSPSFTITMSGVPTAPGRSAIPDPDAIGILLSDGSSRPTEPRKPKQSPARKVRTLCQSLGVADSVLPALAALRRRHIAGQAGRNGFEEAVTTGLASLDTQQLAVLDQAFAAIDEGRRNGTASCLFDDSLVTNLDAAPIEAGAFASALLKVGFPVAAQRLYRGSDGKAGPGQVRMWEQEMAFDPDHHGPDISVRGPWPWLTCVAPASSDYQEFGNVESFRPAPGAVHIWRDHQFSQKCTYQPDETGAIIATCVREHPPAGGGLFGGECPGGPDYRVGDACLRIPATSAGGSIGLRGFNFVNDAVTVHLQLANGNGPLIDQECVVFGDHKTPVSDSEGKTIVDETVKDWIDVPIPSGHPTQPGAPLPAGIYRVWVSVTAPLAGGGAPQVLPSNTLLLRIESPESVKYSLVSERGRCNVETPGMGDDEIWWDAFVAEIKPNQTPLENGQPRTFQMSNLDRKPFPREPWEDMDDGKFATYSHALFEASIFPIDAVKVIALIGFEVDDEDAAREQIKGFWEALQKALLTMITVGLSAEGGAINAAKLAKEAGVITAKAALTATLVAAAIIAAIVVLSLVLWASWAPADLIALDILTLDSLLAFDRTDAHSPVPEEEKRQFGTGDDTVRVTERAFPKKPSTNDPTVATWIQENQYDVEDASYTLEFRLIRKS